MTFRQFAFKNISRNANAYLAYFLSSAFSVMIFFTFATFVFHPELVNAPINKAVRQGMMTAEWIVYIFSFLFVLYSVSIFLKVRNNEFGTYMILGMSRRQLNSLIFMENMIIGILAIITGIVVGFVFLKFFLLLSVKILDIEYLSFYLPLKGVLLTSVSFFILFLVISILTTLFVRTSKIINLLKGEKQPKKEPKVSIVLSLFSAVCLLIGYYLAYKANTNNLSILILPVTFIVTMGTFFFYSQLSVFMIRLLKCNRKFYMKGTNMLWISDLTYRMKDNARMLFLVTIISAVAFTSVATLYLWDDEIKSNKVKEIPFAINYLPMPEDDQKIVQNNVEDIERRLKEDGFQYEKVKLRVIQQKFKYKYIDKIGIINLSEYNKAATVLGLETIALNGNEGYLVPSFYREESQTYEKELLEGKFINFKDKNITLELTGLGERNIMPYGLMGPFVVVGDELFQNLEGKEYNCYGYDIDNWEKTYPIALELKDNKNLKGKIFTAADRYKEDKQASGLLLFIGFFIGGVFFIAAGSFLYFRFYADFTQEKEKYLSITKLGLTNDEMKKAVTIQMALLFFMPYVIAFIHTAFALKPLKMVLTISMAFPVLKVLGGFLLIQIGYFLIIRWKYINFISLYMV